MPTYHKYLITRQEKTGRISIAKFPEDDLTIPVDVYELTGRRCSCPSYKYPCKHVKMVTGWMEFLSRNTDIPNAYYDERTDSYLNVEGEIV